MRKNIARFRRRLLASSPTFTACDGLLRSAFAGVAFAQTIIDYKIHELIFPDNKRRPRVIQRLRVPREQRLVSRDELESVALECVHARTAKRVLRVCWYHGGLYTKMGQYLSTMGHVLPLAIITPLSVLTDHAMPLDWEEMQPVIEEDFGVGATKRFFKHVDQKPVASASLAQVHRAILRDTGEPVALKVQYPHLQQQTAGDLRTLEAMARIVAWVFPKCDFKWVVPEFHQNHTHELDFRQEAYNSNRVKSLLSQTCPYIYIPNIHWNMTSRRCLVMEFVEGVKVTDQKGMAKLQVDRKRLANVLLHAFSQLIFNHGFVHCDPHPGNLLVQQKNHALRLVLLDHGMYRRISPGIRHGHCMLWASLFSLDRQAGISACRKLSVAPRFLNVLSLMLFSRGYDNNELPSASELARRIKQVKVEDANDFFRSLPRDLLWIFRTLNILRCITTHLGMSNDERSAALALQAWDVLAREKSPSVVQQRTVELAFDNLQYLTEAYKETVSKVQKVRGDSTWSELPHLGPIALQSLTNPELGSILSARAGYWLSKIDQEKLTKKYIIPVHMSFRGTVPWFLLSGAGTLNLPLASEVRQLYYMPRLSFFHRLKLWIASVLLHCRFKVFQKLCGLGQASETLFDIMPEIKLFGDASHASS